MILSQFSKHLLKMFYKNKAILNYEIVSLLFDLYLYILLSYI